MQLKFLPTCFIKPAVFGSVRRLLSLLFVRKTIIFTLSVLISFLGEAQTFLERNVSGTSSTSLQLGSTSAKRTQQLYTSAELGAAPTSAGNIEEIYFMYNSVAAQTFSDLEVYIGQTTSTALVTDLAINFSDANMVKVLGPTSFTIPAGSAGAWFAIPLTTPYFNYDPTKSLVVETRWSANPTSTSWTVRTGASDASGTNRKAYDATPTGTGGTLSTARANFRLKIVDAPANDAGIVSIDYPTTPSNPGTSPVNVTLKNYGSANLATVQINWSVDGIAQTPFAWTGGLATGGTTSVTLGSFNFTAGTHTIEASPSLPNGSADAYPVNDQASKSVIFCAAISGTVQVNSAFPVSDPALGQFQNFTDLAAQLTACGISGNVVINVVANSGPYNEKVVFNSIPNVGAGATITINGNGNIITSPTVQADRNIFTLNKISYFTINNLEFELVAGSTAFVGVHAFESANNVTISNCTFDLAAVPTTNSLFAGIVINNDAGVLSPGGTFDNISITGNTVINGGYGVSVVGLTSPLATNVTLSNNNIEFSESGVYLRETDGVMIHGNTFNKNHGSSGGTGVNVAQTANINTVIRNNYIKMTATAGGLVGVFLNAGTGHKVYNNVIYDINSQTGTSNPITGITLRTASSASEVYNNTISIDNPTGTTQNIYGIRVETSGTNGILRNNLISISQPTTAFKSAIMLNANTAVNTTFNSDHNVFYVPDGHVAGYMNVAVPTSYATTLADWQNLTPYDDNSWSANPDFESLTLPRPRNGLINNRGTSFGGLTTDIIGAARGATPDIGAYEFSPAGNDAAIISFVSPALPFCGNQLSVQFELSNSGADPLTSAVINWTVNGVAQPVVNWAGPTLAPGAITIVTLGNFAVSGSTAYALSATVTSPNGQPDANPANNTFTFSGFRRGMNGVFSIDKNAAVSSTNYISFQSISNDLSLYGVCGPVTINVANGPYTEQVIFDSIPGVNSSNTVTLDGQNQELNFNPTVASTDHILQLSRINYMTVQNLSVKSTHASNGRGIFITNNSSNLTITNNTVEVTKTNTSSTAFGIIASGTNYLLDGSLSENLIITGNTVIGGYSGIQLTGDGFNDVSQKLRNATVSNNTVQDFYAFGVYLNYNDNTIVSGNQISRPTRTNSGSDSQTPAGIICSAGATGFMLDKNRIFDLQKNMGITTTIGRGIYISGTSTAQSNGTVQNNLVYGMSTDGAQYGIQNNSTVGPIKIYHNTVVLDNGAGSGAASAIYLSNSSAQTGTDIKNNVLFVTRGGSGIKRIFDVSSASTSFNSDNNATWLVVPSGTAQFGKVGTPTYADLTAWRAATSKDINTIEGVDPQFANPSTGDFKPTNLSLDNLGSPVGVNTDIDNQPRSATTPDVGAYEFGPSTFPIYTFIGSGNWNNTVNWTNGVIPPSPLPAGSEIIINPTDGEAIVNVPVTIGPGGKLTVRPGKSLVVQGNLTIQP